MEKTLQNKLEIVILVALAGLVVFAFWKSQPVQGAATSGSQTTYATSSTLQVGPNYVQVLSIAFENCTSRTISTGPTAIRLSFGGISATSTATSTAQINSDVGLWQSASTTVAYDGGLYGCGFVGVIGQNTSTSTVTLEVFN